MAEHFGFAEDEWDLLLELPLDIFLCMLQADAAVGSLDREHQALVSWLERSAQGSVSPWIKSALEAADRPSVAQAHGSGFLAPEVLGAKLHELSELLEHRVGSAQARAFKELLLQLAEQVGAASSGVITGAPRITQTEADLIWLIRQSLGLVESAAARS